MSDSDMGSMLRTRREELGISLEMAATATNIRARVLDVLEKGEFSSFPPYGHAMGMISSYARYLDTDPRPILRAFEREWAEHEAAERMSSSAERTRRGVGRFGERAAQSDRPSQRGSRGREGQSPSPDRSTGGIHTKLDEERLAEEDDRYKSGTVRVVGTRQTGDFRRVGARRPRGSADERGSYRRGTDRGGTGAQSSSVTSERGADRLFDDGASANGHETTGRQSERGTSLSRAGSRYSRYSTDRYTRASSSHQPGSFREVPDNRLQRGGARRERSAREPLENRRTGSAERVRAGHREGPAPDFFSPEKLDREQHSRERRSQAVRRKVREGDGQSDESIVQRLVSLVQEAFSERRTRAIAIGIVAFVVVVAIIAGVLISTAGNGDTGVIAVEGGAADTTKSTSDPNSASATVTTTNGNPVNVSIDVAEGQTSLVNVTYDDDNAYNGTAVGAWHREFLVTESLEATFGNPDAVTVTENGNPVSIDKDSDGTGKMSLTIKTTSTSTTTGSVAESSSSKKKSSKKSSKKKSSSGSSSSSSS